MAEKEAEREVQGAYQTATGILPSVDTYSPPSTVTGIICIKSNGSSYVLLENLYVEKNQLTLPLEGENWVYTKTKFFSG